MLGTVSSIGEVDFSPTALADYAQMQYGLENLEKHDFKVDLILTHTMPAFLIRKLGFSGDLRDPVTDYFNEVFQLTEYKHWFCGHMHIDKFLPEYSLTVVYDDYHKAVPYSK